MPLHVAPARCSDRDHLGWRVSNRNPFPVAFSWRVLRPHGRRQGVGLAAAAVGGRPSQTFFTTVSHRGWNEVGVFVDGDLEDVAARWEPWGPRRR